MAIITYSLTEKEDILKKLRVTEKDTSSAAVMVARLTFKISKLALHIEKNKKDIPVERRQKQEVAVRKRWIKYLLTQNAEKHKMTLELLNLRK